MPERQSLYSQHAQTGGPEGHLNHSMYWVWWWKSKLCGGYKLFLLHRLW